MYFFTNPKLIKAVYLLISILSVLLINLTYYFFDICSKNFAPLVPKADAIVVLGAAVWPNEKPSPVLSDRLLRAAELYKMGISSKIICTGGVGKNPPSEAQVSKTFLISQGVAEKDILYEDISTSTREQAIEVSKICQRENFKSIALVTSFFHEKRAIRIFELANFPAAIFDARCVHTRYQDLNWWCLREAVFLAKLNWWQWLAVGIALGIFFIVRKTYQPQKK